MSFCFVEHCRHIVGRNAFIHRIAAEKTQRLAEAIQNRLSCPAPSPRCSKGDEKHLLVEFDGTTAQALDKAQEIWRQRGHRRCGPERVRGSGCPCGQWVLRALLALKL